jgi:hypothetical protein
VRKISRLCIQQEVKSKKGIVNAELNEWEIQVLKNKLPDQKILRRNILLRLDVALDFNRIKLAQCIAKQGLNGYSRQHLYKILGKPTINSKEYKIMSKAFNRIGNPELLNLIIQRNVYKAITNSSLGCSKNGQAER